MTALEVLVKAVAWLHVFMWLTAKRQPLLCLKMNFLNVYLGWNETMLHIFLLAIWILLNIFLEELMSLMGSGWNVCCFKKEFQLCIYKIIFDFLPSYPCFISYSLIKRGFITFMCNQTKKFHLVGDNMGGKSWKTAAYNLNRDALWLTGLGFFHSEELHYNEFSHRLAVGLFKLIGIN